MQRYLCCYVIIIGITITYSWFGYKKTFFIHVIKSIVTVVIFCVTLDYIMHNTNTIYILCARQITGEF